MKCDDCINLLEAYIDGEAAAHEADLVRTHLVTCSGCAGELEALTAEGELYGRYDRELSMSPAVWNGIAARIATESPAVETHSDQDRRGWFAGWFSVPRFGLAFSGAMAVLLAMFVVGYLFLRTSQPDPQLLLASAERVKTGMSITNPASQSATSVSRPVSSKDPQRVAPALVAQTHPPKHTAPLFDDPGVLFTDAAYTDIEDKDTASHLEQAQKLLVSFRSLPSEDDQDVDVSYEKTESRRLLNENVVLRRDAEMAGKFPTKSVLGSLEPFLIDIANLPDKAPASDVRQIKDRVQRTEIVAELRSY